MKRIIALAVTVLIMASGILTGCSKGLKTDSDQDLKKLTDCFALTKNADSLEAELTTSTEKDGQAEKMELYMKFEDIKKGFKCLVNMNMADQHQELYMGTVNGKTNVYMKDTSGKYTVNSVDSSEVGGMDIMKSFNAYTEIVENNPEMFKKLKENTYQMKVPNEKSAEIYSKIAGKKLEEKLENLTIDFIIGDDKYLENVNLTTTVKSMSLKMYTHYFNYGKSFNIVLPDVSK